MIHPEFGGFGLDSPLEDFSGPPWACMTVWVNCCYLFILITVVNIYIFNLDGTSIVPE